MATLDISSALNSMVQASTPQAQMERHLGLAMFSEKVGNVTLQAKQELLQIGKETKRALKNDEIDPDVAALLVESSKDSVIVRNQFEKNYFG